MCVDQLNISGMRSTYSELGNVGRRGSDEVSEARKRRAIHLLLKLISESIIDGCQGNSICECGRNNSVIQFSLFERGSWRQRKQKSSVILQTNPINTATITNILNKITKT